MSERVPKCKNVLGPVIKIFTPFTPNNYTIVVIVKNLFVEGCCLVGCDTSWSVMLFFDLKMEAVCSSEMSVHIYQTVWYHIPENSLQCHSNKNMKSYNIFVVQVTQNQPAWLWTG
jgi:hypothetical protein